MKFVHSLLVLGTVLCLLGIFLFVKQAAAASDPYSAGLLAQNYSAGLLAQNYQGPTKPIPGDPQLIRVEVLVKDSPDLAGVQIQSVTFDGKTVPLKPRDIYGNRGSTSFQRRPGKYTLRWTVKRDKIVWPRTITHEEEVNLDPRDFWVQVSIDGETASIR